MKVKELIKKLSECDLEAVVVVLDDMGFVTADEVNSYENENVFNTMIDRARMVNMEKIVEIS